MIGSVLGAVVGLLQVAKIAGVVETIYCPQDLHDTRYQLDPNSTLLILNAELTLFLEDDFQLYARDATVDITVNNVLAAMKADMYRLDLSKQQKNPLPVRYVEYNYEAHGFARRLHLDEEHSGLDSLRVVTVPRSAFDVYYMPESFKRRLQQEVEACLELQTHFELGRIHKSKLLQLPNYSRGCAVPELHHVPPPTTPFQDVINKVADVVVHKIVEEFLDPVEGQIEAPELTIGYRQYFFATGTFSVYNGTLRDLRRIKRKSNVTVSRNDQLLTLSGRFDIKDVSLIYKNYTVTGTVRSTGNNVTVSFEDGVVVDVVVHIDTNEFPCGIKLHQLKVSSDKPGKIKATDASSFINSSAKDEFLKQNVAILKKFGDKLKEYVESQMDQYDCKTVRLLDFLEKPLNKFLSTLTSTEEDNAVDYYKNKLGVNREVVDKEMSLLLKDTF